MTNSKLILLVLSVLLSNIFSAGAAEAQANVSLAIEPPKIEIKGNPGSKFKDQFAVVNRGNSTVRFRVSVRDFKITDENSRIEFFDAAENPAKAWIIPEFVEIKLVPSEAKNIKFITAIPENIGSRSHLAAILLEPIGAEKSAAMGTLVLVNVVGGQGMAVTGGKIQEFSASRIQDYPVRFQVQLANLGNTYLKTEGKIILKNWRNQIVAELAGTPQIIYPDNAGLVKWRWNNDDVKFGLFRAELQLMNLQNKENKLAGATWLLVMPWKQAVGWSFAAAVILFFLFKYRKKLFFLRRFFRELKMIKKLPLPVFKKV